jgi:hypothetical protein
VDPRNVDAVLIDLRDRLDEMLHQIRRLCNIKTPMITCLKCGNTAHAAEPRVSMRAMILSLGRFEIAPKEQVKALEKAWAKYREQHDLDIEGKAERFPSVTKTRPISLATATSLESPNHSLRSDRY